MHLGDGSGASTLAVTDEASGALLSAVVFPQYHWTQVAARAVQAALRPVFARWLGPARPAAGG